MVSKYRYYYLADNTHRKCLVAGNAADSHVYHQDHGDRANASWSFVPSASFPGFYHIVDRKHGLALVAGERYDGRCYHQALTGRDNELWFPEQVGDARAFCFRDKRHGRHLVTGNRYDGNIYHQDAAGRGNATWTLQLAAMGDDEPTFYTASAGAYRVPGPRRVCHHGAFEFYCGKCKVDGSNCLDLSSGERVVCHHGAEGGRAWEGACTNCHVDGRNCAVIGLLQRVVCHHNGMKTACGGCGIDHQHCLVLDPGVGVGCHHRGFTGYCGGCRVDGKYCKKVPMPVDVRVSWHLADARRSEVEEVTVDQIYLEGPGSCELELGAPLPRSRAIVSPEGRALAVGPDIVAGIPELTAGKVALSEPRDWPRAIADPAVWERPVTKTETATCGEGTWLVEAVCSRRGIDVPFRFFIGEVSYPAVFSTTDYFDPRIRKTLLTTPEEAPSADALPQTVSASEYRLWGFTLKAAERTASGATVYRAALDPIVLSAGDVELFRISSTALEAIVGPDELGGSFSGGWSLLEGVLGDDFSVEISRSGFTLPLYKRIKAGRASKSKDLSIYYGGSLRLEWGLFRLTYGPSIKVFVRVLGRRITLRVDSRIIAEIDDSSFTQGVYFKVSAMSLTFELGAFTVAVPFRDVADLAKAFADFAEDEVVDRLKEWLAGPFADAYDWVKYNVTAVAEEAAKFFEDVGAAPGQIAKGLAAAFELDPGDAVAMLSVPMDEAKKILEDGFDWTSDQVDDWAKTVGGGFVGFVKGIF